MEASNLYAEENPTNIGSGSSPWGTEGLSSEEDSRASSSYFFHCYGRTSRVILEGRRASGLSKFNVRRRLTKAIGKDFGLYTGGGLGEMVNADAGIRGEMNKVIRHVSNQISPSDVPRKPYEEDAIIMSDPAGALEVLHCYQYLFSTLTSRYPAMQRGHRNILRNLLDEEYLKWNWRMFYGFLLNPGKMNWSNEGILSTYDGLPPHERHASSTRKLIANGLYLMSSEMNQSPLLQHCAFFFCSFIYELQARTINSSKPKYLDACFEEICKGKEPRDIISLLAAIDFLFYCKGDSQKSLDDILGPQGGKIEGENGIPQRELDFIASKVSYNEHSFEKIVAPLVNKKEGYNLMPVLLYMRTLPTHRTNHWLAHLTAPVLSMLSNRMTSSKRDEVSDVILRNIRRELKLREDRGEKHSIAPKVSTGSFERVSSSEAGQSKPSSEMTSVNVGQIPIDVSVVLAWKITQHGVSIQQLPYIDVVKAVGLDKRFLIPWVLYALRTHQIFQPPERIDKKAVLDALRQCPNIRPTYMGSLSEEQRQEWLDKHKGASPKSMLQSMLHSFGQTGKQGNKAKSRFHKGIFLLYQRFGQDFNSFIAKPNSAQFIGRIKKMSLDERVATHALALIARLK